MRRLPALALAALLAAPGVLAAQSQARTVATHAPPPPPAPVAAAEEALRDSAEIQTVARRHARAVRNCYQEQGLKGDPTLRGLLLVELLVLPTGQVESAAATAEEVRGDGMPAVAACVGAAARGWRFGDGAPRSERIVLEFDLLPPAP